MSVKVASVTSATAVERELRMEAMKTAYALSRRHEDHEDHEEILYESGVVSFVFFVPS